MMLNRNLKTRFPQFKLMMFQLLRIDEYGSLELKIKLEVEDTQGKYILYAPYAEPAPEDDWLLDIKLYSYIFHADQASILLKELNLEHQSLRPYLKKRKAFFKSQERLTGSKNGSNLMTEKMILT